ncbi:MAG: cytochrome c oxidase accessory protein CcoG, partial [Burkholderiales bacterium]|nr:cytochrome c oxidase accessory protein CcoG [Burkholderiales bacterium]
FKVTVGGLPTLAVAGDSEFEIPAATSKQVPLRLQIDQGQAGPGSHKIDLDVVDAEDPGVSVKERSVFLVR